MKKRNLEVKEPGLLEKLRQKTRESRRIQQALYDAKKELGFKILYSLLEDQWANVLKTLERAAELGEAKVRIKIQGTNIPQIYGLVSRDLEEIVQKYIREEKKEEICVGEPGWEPNAEIEADALLVTLNWDPRMTFSKFMIDQEQACLL